MEQRTPFILSLILNVALAGTLAMVLLCRPGAPVSRTGTQGEKTALVARPQADLRVVTEITVLTNAVPLDWHSIESSDYKQYIANLKAVGCPWLTIKDIIVGDVHRLYAPRLAALHADRPPYWRQQNRGLKPGDMERHRHLNAIRKEKTDLIENLLGIEWKDEVAAMTGIPPYRDAALDFLPPDKQQAVEELRQKRNEALQVILGGNQFVFEDDRREQERIDRQLRAGLAALLTPEELTEYDLRFSDTANRIRRGMVGFQLTEEEFRKIYEIQRVFDESNGAYESGVLYRGDEKEKAKAVIQGRDEQIREALGPERFAAYQRGRDPEFEVLHSVAERFGAPSGAAEQAYLAKKTVNDELTRLYQDGSLTGEQRELLRAALRQEFEESLRTILGNDGFLNYRQWNQEWFTLHLETRQVARP